MSSTCFEPPEGSSSGTRLFIQLWYGAFYMHRYKQSCRQKCVLDSESQHPPVTSAFQTHHTIIVYTAIFLKMNPGFRNM